MRYFMIWACIALGISFKSVFSQNPTSTAPDIKTFGLQADQIGSASSTVNLLTGDVALPLNLVFLAR